MKDDRKFAVYTKIRRTTGSPREIEAEALTLGAEKLMDCRENWSAINSETLFAALKYNQRLWSIFQAELRSPDCPLPPRLRNNLLRLSAFIDKQIFLIMADPAPGKLTPIIDVNLGIVQGLRNKPPSLPAETTDINNIGSWRARK